ncbi:hypothetical protein B0H11DRAFT_2402209 [Mycena galericulata]|nr:hypothetical protein B0H11DRAFT_2402209 [Mycena galericulata]
MKPRSLSRFYGPDLSRRSMRHHCSRGFKPQMSLFAWLVPSHPCAWKLRVACGACSVLRIFLIAQHSITGSRHSVFHGKGAFLDRSVEMYMVVILVRHLDRRTHWEVLDIPDIGSVEGLLRLAVSTAVPGSASSIGKLGTGARMFVRCPGLRAVAKRVVLWVSGPPRGHGHSGSEPDCTGRYCRGEGAYVATQRPAFP